jgi:peptidoglycan/LPS O-acetylase OafA/YrhL
MRFHLVDALRGIASLWVVFYHSYAGGHVYNFLEAIPGFVASFFFETGWAGVPIFFVISGFVIAHSISRDEVDGLYLAKFTVRRSIRLDPPYWGSIALFVSMAWLSSTVKNEAIHFPSTETIIAHLFYVQGVLEIENINPVYWTLCLEIQFYLVLCILIYFTQHLERYTKSKYAFKSVIFLISLISLLWPTEILSDNIYPGLFFPLWHSFLLGVFAYWSWKKMVPLKFFYVYSAIILFSSFSSQTRFSLVAVLTAVLIHECARFGRIASANWRWIQFLGTISYSLYLTHNPIAGASLFILDRFLGSSAMAQFFAFVISTLSCILFAYVFWLVFESWSIRLSKKFTLHRSPVSK